MFDETDELDAWIARGQSADSPLVSRLITSAGHAQTHGQVLTDIRHRPDDQVRAFFDDDAAEEPDDDFGVMIALSPPRHTPRKVLAGSLRRNHDLVLWHRIGDQGSAHPLAGRNDTPRK